MDDRTDEVEDDEDRDADEDRNDDEDGEDLEIGPPPLPTDPALMTPDERADYDKTHPRLKDYDDPKKPISTV